MKLFLFCFRSECCQREVSVRLRIVNVNAEAVAILIDPNVDAGPRTIVNADANASGWIRRINWLWGRGRHVDDFTFDLFDHFRAVMMAWRRAAMMAWRTIVPGRLA
jgi:hypothetical protein